MTLIFPLMSWLLNLDFIFIRAILGLKIQQSVRLILKTSRLPYSSLHTAISLRADSFSVYFSAV